jgi:ankyrin repeat protein
MSNERPEGGLPRKPDLDQLRKQAKELHASGGHVNLAAAQLALARSYGFPSWSKLKRSVELATLRRLIEGGDVAGLRRLLRSSPRLARAAFDEGDTPLHLAAERNRPDLIETLVRAGAPLQVRYGRSGHSPLSWAITTWSFDAALKLVDLGDEPDLFCAAGLGMLDRVRAFWDADGRLRRQPSVTGSSRRNDSGARLPCPPPAESDQVSDALYLACRSDRPEVARWLLDHGADPNWRGFCGATCLAWAEMAGNPELCALVRARGGSDDLLDQQYQATPRAFGMMVLAAWGFADRLRARLTADPTLVNVSGGRGTLLCAAAHEGQRETAEILLAFGADRTARTAEGRTAAEVAEAAGHLELAALLR